MSLNCRQPLAGLGRQEVAAAQSRTELSSVLDAPTLEQPHPEAPGGHNLATVLRQRIGEDSRALFAESPGPFQDQLVTGRC